MFCSTGSTRGKVEKYIENIDYLKTYRVKHWLVGSGVRSVYKAYIILAPEISRQVTTLMTLPTCNGSTQTDQTS